MYRHDDTSTMHKKGLLFAGAAGLRCLTIALS